MPHSAVLTCLNLLCTYAEHTYHTVPMMATYGKTLLYEFILAYIEPITYTHR